MGSTGSGRFGTYSNGGAGSITDGEECPLVIENIRLEDVAISDYYLDHSGVPLAGEAVELTHRLVNKRLVAVLTGTQEIIGNLPVSYNYLNICLKKGKRYSGKIKASGLSPIPFIVVNLYG